MDTHVALIPAAWLAESGAVGPFVPVGGAEDPWATVCDLERFGEAAFVEAAARKDVWLYDRPAALYLAHARTGSIDALLAARREAEMYRDGLRGEGAALRIGVPEAADDLKYHYAQGLAMHYLMTGDEASRLAAIAIARRAHALWPRPGWRPGDPFWTERHAGFALLAYVWAATVAEGADRDELVRWADEAADAYLALHDAGPGDADSRCFVHGGAAHEDEFAAADGCSPWMSAILAEALETYAELRGGGHAIAVRAALISLGRAIAQRGRDEDGRPYYWMNAAGGGVSEPYDEHWGESAYVVALAWHHDGRRDQELRHAVDDLLHGLRTRGEAGQLRSYNWQCRTAPRTPYYL